MFFVRELGRILAELLDEGVTGQQSLLVLQPCSLSGLNSTDSPCLQPSQLPLVRASSEVVDLMCALTWLVGLVLSVECVYFWTSHISVFSLFKPGYRFPEMYLWMYELISLFIHTPSSVDEAHAALAETTPSLTSIAHPSSSNSSYNHHSSNSNSYSYSSSSSSSSNHTSSSSRSTVTKPRLPWLLLNPFPFLTHVLFTRNSRVSDTPAAVSGTSGDGSSSSSSSSSSSTSATSTSGMTSNNESGNGPGELVDSMTHNRHLNHSSLDDTIAGEVGSISCLSTVDSSGNFVKKCNVSESNSDDGFVDCVDPGYYSSSSSMMNDRNRMDDARSIFEHWSRDGIMQEPFWEGGLKRWTAKWYLNLSESAKTSIHALTYRRRHCTPDIIERLRHLRVENLRQCVYFAVLGALNVLLRLDCTIVSFVPPSFLSALFFLSLPNAAQASLSSVRGRGDSGSGSSSSYSSTSSFHLGGSSSESDCSGMDSSSMNDCANLVAAAFVTTVDISAFECFIACRVSYVLLFLSSSFYSLISDVTAASDGCTEECFASFLPSSMLVYNHKRDTTNGGSGGSNNSDSTSAAVSSSSSKKNHHHRGHHHSSSSVKYRNHCNKTSSTTVSRQVAGSVSCWRQWIRLNSPLSMSKHGYLQFNQSHNSNVMNITNINQGTHSGNGLIVSSSSQPSSNVSHPTGIGVNNYQSSTKTGREKSGNNSNNRNHHYYHHYSTKKKNASKHHHSHSNGVSDSEGGGHAQSDYYDSSAMHNECHHESFESVCQRRALWLHNYGRKDRGFVLVSLLLTAYNLFECVEWIIILGLFFNLIVASLVL